MSHVYTSIIRPVIANTFLLGSFDLSVFQNLHCGKKSSMMHSNVSTIYLFYFIYLFIIIFNLFCFLSIYLFTFLFVYFIFIDLFIWLNLFNQEDRF